MAQEFSDRAKLRLRLAAGLIGGEGHTLKLDRTNFYPEMIRVIEQQPPEERERIKELAMESKDVIKSVPKAMKEANEAAKSVLVDAAKDHSHRVS